MLLKVEIVEFKSSMDEHAEAISKEPEEKRRPFKRWRLAR